MPFALVGAILPGKTEAARNLVQQINGPRKAEYDDLSRRQGATSEYQWLQSTPEGDMMIVHGDGDLKAPAEFMDPENNAFDRWFRDQILEIAGFDIMEMPAQPSELLREWHDA